MENTSLKPTCKIGRLGPKKEAIIIFQFHPFSRGESLRFQDKEGETHLVFDDFCFLFDFGSKILVG